MKTSLFRTSQLTPYKFLKVAVFFGLLNCCSGYALADPQATFTKQVVLSTLSNQISGQRVGGSFQMSGSGLGNVAPFSLSNNGNFNGSNGSVFTTSPNETFSFNSSAKTADPVGGGISLSGSIVSPGVYSAQQGFYSGREFSTSSSGGSDALISNGVAPPDVNVGNHLGQQVSVTRTGQLKTSHSQIESTRSARSENFQSYFDQEAQSAKFSASGSGLSAISTGGFMGGEATAGKAVPITAIVGGNECHNCAEYTAHNSIRQGDDSQQLKANPQTPTQPGYGKINMLSGGSTAGQITIDGASRELKASPGGTGTMSFLNQSVSLSVFR